MAEDNDSDYDHLLLLDLAPRQNYPHVSCVSIENTGIRRVHHGRLKLSKGFRLRPMQLPIYKEKALYHVIAKTHKSCDNYDRNRATTLLNVHVFNCLKAGMMMDSVVASTVENFPCRLLKGKNFGAMNEPLSKYAGNSARHQAVAVSSTDTDGFATDRTSTPITSALEKNKGIRSRQPYIFLPTFLYIAFQLRKDEQKRPRRLQRRRLPSKTPRLPASPQRRRQSSHFQWPPMSTYRPTSP